ncbi:unnamed protein product, partial [Sphagnum jensenii]
MVGVMESLMGILRLRWLVHFISHSIISGFTSASAIIIAFSQAKSFLGYSITRSTKIVPLIESIYAGCSQFKWQPFVMGSLVLVGLLVMKHVGKTFKHLRSSVQQGLLWPYLAAQSLSSWFILPLSVWDKDY